MRDCLLITLGVLFLLGTALADTEEKGMEIAIVSPLDYQVFQGGENNQAVVPVRVSGPLAGSKVEVSLWGVPGQDNEGPEWVKLTENAGGAYAAKLTVTAGGWYRLEVRAEASEGAALEAQVPHVGVGEVFVVCGQSNAANCGDPCQRPEDDRVVAFDGKSWRPGYDPQPAASGEGGSPWPYLGDLLARSLQRPIGFASVAVGGSHTYQWLPEGGELWPKLLNMVKALGPQGARAVLWHQGESDVLDQTSAEEYARRLSVIIEALDQEASYRLPWVVAEAAFHPEARAGAVAEVRRGQHLLWEREVAYQGPLTDDLLGPTYRRDSVHFNEMGLRVHAERWFAMLWAEFFADPVLSHTR